MWALTYGCLPHPVARPGCSTEAVPLLAAAGRLQPVRSPHTPAWFESRSMGGLHTLTPPSAGFAGVEEAAGPATNAVPDLGDLAAAARAYQDFRSQAGPADTPAPAG